MELLKRDHKGRKARSTSEPPAVISHPTAKKESGLGKRRKPRAGNGASFLLAIADLRRISSIKKRKVFAATRNEEAAAPGRPKLQVSV